MMRQFKIGFLGTMLLVSFSFVTHAQINQAPDLSAQIQIMDEIGSVVPKIPTDPTVGMNQNPLAAEPDRTVEQNQNPLAVGPGQTVVPTTEELGLLKAMNEAEVKALSAPYVRPDIRSLMFTPYQYSLLLEAQKGFNVNVSNKDLGIEGSAGSVGSQQQAAIGEQPQENIKSIREIFLGGIVYNSEKVWTIYLNGQRITLENIPAEVMNLKVSKDYIDLLWLDRQTNKIFPVRMRANQRFNLDSGLFLPGKSG